MFFFKEGDLPFGSKSKVIWAEIPTDQEGNLKWLGSPSLLMLPQLLSPGLTRGTVCLGRSSSRLYANVFLIVSRPLLHCEAFKIIY